MRLELANDFLREAGVPLDGEDLRLGVSLGLISPPTAIAVAAEAVRRGASDPSLLELAELERDDVASVRVVLRAVDPEDADLFPPESVRKWAYLELKAAYEIRDRLRDPLGVVEEIYADFDYPSAVAGFVRYMPAPAGAAIGEDALYDRWAAYLASEALELTTRDGQS
jgi:hypothetical protein